MSRFALLSRRCGAGELVLEMDEELVAVDRLVTIGRLFAPSPPLRVDGANEAVLYVSAPHGLIDKDGHETGEAAAVLEVGHLGLMARFAHTADVPDETDWAWWGQYAPDEETRGVSWFKPNALGGLTVPTPGDARQITIAIPTNGRRWLQLVWSPEVRRLRPGAVTLRMRYHAECHGGAIAPSVSALSTALAVELVQPE